MFEASARKMLVATIEKFRFPYNNTKPVVYFLSEVIINRIVLFSSIFGCTFADMKQRVTQLLKEMSVGLYDKDVDCTLTLLTALAGESILLLGPPGIGKSLIARRMKTIFKDARNFEYLMSRFSTPDEIFGPVSIRKMKENDLYERNTEGYLPTADIVFLDEIWKAGPAIQNSLLTAINEKVFRNGKQDVRLPMKLLIAASNELPAEDEGLEALWDRFIVRVICTSITNRNAFESMILDDQTHTVRQSKLAITNEEYEKWQTEIVNIKVPSSILDAIEAIRQALKTLPIKNDEEEEKRMVYVSDRRWKKIIRLLRTSALMQGRKEVQMSDLLLLRYCLWQEMDEIEPINRLIIRAIFKECTQSLLNLRNEVKNYIKRKIALEAQAVMTASPKDRDKKIYDQFYFHIMDHDAGHTYIVIADYQNLPSPKAGRRPNPERGIMYKNPVKAEETIIRLCDPLYETKPLPEGWQRISIFRDDDHLFINGIQYEIEKLAWNKQLSTPLPKALPQRDFYSEIEEICDRLQFLQKHMAGSLFYRQDDEKIISEYINKVNKEIANTRVEISKTIPDE